MVGVTSLSLAQTASMPDLQQRFLSLVDDFADKYKSAPNDMAKGALRAQRAKEICALLKKPFKVQGWRGTVAKLSSNNEGKGVLVVDLNKISAAQTWNNALSDLSHKTLITPGTQLHDAAMQLSRKQEVIFSGQFLPSDKDCIREGSLTQAGSMTDPDWIFRFSEIEPAIAREAQEQAQTQRLPVPPPKPSDGPAPASDVAPSTKSADRVSPPSGGASGPAVKTMDAIDFLVDGKEMVGKWVTVTGCSIQVAANLVTCQVPVGFFWVDKDSLSKEDLRQSMRQCSPTSPCPADITGVVDTWADGLTLRQGKIAWKQ